MRHSQFKKKAYLWMTLLLFFLSVAAHWYFGWKAYIKEQAEHHQIPQFNDFMIEAMRDTMENWQSEFLQLIWQVVGLSYLWYVGSPSSKEGDDRKEEKIDRILEKLDPENTKAFLKAMEDKYPKE